MMNAIELRFMIFELGDEPDWETPDYEYKGDPSFHQDRLAGAKYIRDGIFCITKQELLSQINVTEIVMALMAGQCVGLIPLPDVLTPLMDFVRATTTDFDIRGISPVYFESRMWAPSDSDRATLVYKVYAS